MLPNQFSRASLVILNAFILPLFSNLTLRIAAVSLASVKVYDLPGCHEADLDTGIVAVPEGECYSKLAKSISVTCSGGRDPDVTAFQATQQGQCRSPYEYNAFVNSNGCWQSSNGDLFVGFQVRCKDQTTTSKASSTTSSTSQDSSTTFSLSTDTSQSRSKTSTQTSLPSSSLPASSIPSTSPEPVGLTGDQRINLGLGLGVGLPSTLLAAGALVIAFLECRRMKRKDRRSLQNQMGQRGRRTRP